MSEDYLKLRDQDLEWREVEGDLVVLDLRESRYLAINRTGQALWAALVEGATQDDLIARLVKTFDIERTRAAADVAAFTTELESRGLLLHEASSSYGIECRLAEGFGQRGHRPDRPGPLRLGDDPGQRQERPDLRGADP